MSRHIKQITYRTLEDAERGLQLLKNIIDAYKVATIANYYDINGIKYNSLDFQYGWTDLEDTMIIEKPEGYTIDLPEAEEIE